jgi:AcrR family transcriptional regulator
VGIIERRLREKQQRIDQIVEAAKKIFQVKGFAESTMNDIADSSELSRRTVYIYFKHKEELLLSIAAKGLNSLADHIEACLNGEGSTMDRARALFRHYGLLVAEDPGAYRFLMRYHEGVQVVGDQHDLAVACRAAIKRNLDALTTLLVQGADDGSFRKFQDPVSVGRSLFFLICNSIEASVVSVSILRTVMEVEPEAMVDSLFDIFATYLNPVPIPEN